MARLLVIAVCVAALCVTCSAASNAQAFKATLAPLPNTTGVNLGGSGSAVVELAPSGLNKLTVSVQGLVCGWRPFILVNDLPS